MLKKILPLLAILAIANCAGRAPNPVTVIQPGDRNLDCDDLESMMSEIQGNINRLMPESEKTGKNVVKGVAGAFFIVPLFFMDFSESEKVEIEAFRSRYNHLARLYNKKGCGKREMINPFKKDEKKDEAKK